MYEYEMEPTRTVGATERMRDGRTDAQTDGGSETNIPPTTTSLREGYDKYIAASL